MAFIKVQKLIYNEEGKIQSGSATIVDTHHGNMALSMQNTNMTAISESVITVHEEFYKVIPIQDKNDEWHAIRHILL